MTGEGSVHHAAPSMREREREHIGHGLVFNHLAHMAWWWLLLLPPLCSDLAGWSGSNWDLRPLPAVF